MYCVFLCKCLLLCPKIIIFFSQIYAQGKETIAKDSYVCHYYFANNMAIMITNKYVISVPVIVGLSFCFGHSFEKYFWFNCSKHCTKGTPVSSCSKTGSIRDDPYWTSRKNSFELIELSSINKVSLV